MAPTSRRSLLDDLGAANGAPTVATLPTPPRARARLMAWVLLGAWVCVAATNLAFVWTGHHSEDDYVPLMLTGYAVVGAVVAVRRPGNAVGWLFQTIALVLSVQAVAEAYVLLDPRPGQVAVAWVAGWLFNLWFILLGVFLLLVFPDGRLLSRRWRPVLWLGVAALVGSFLVDAFAPGELSVYTGTENPLGVHGAAAVAVQWIRGVTTALLVVLLPLSALSLVLRVRRSRGVQRQQVRWFVLAGLVMLFGLALATSEGLFKPYGDVVANAGWAIFLVMATVGIPVATAMALLRHHLYDVDVVIHKTIVYGALTAALLSTYVVLVVVLRMPVQRVTGHNDLAVALSTLAVAALFRPVRSRIQRSVDRRFYRHRYDSARTLDAFAGRLRHELDLDAVTEDLCVAVSECVEPTTVSIWLRP